MLDVVDRLGAALLDAGLAATAITGLVVLAMIQCRQPARRRGWARGGLISSLALLPLASLNPVPRIDLRAPLRAILPMDMDVPISPANQPNPECSRTFDHTDSTVDRPGSPAVGPRKLRLVARLLVMVYLAVVSVGLCWLAIGVGGSVWLIRRSLVPSPSTLAHYRELPFEGWADRPGLRVSERTSRPVLMGSVKPVILIPPELDDPTSGNPLRLGLLHELAHAENLDHRFGPAASVAQVIWFFLPPAWWIRDQMKLDQEFLADRRAVAHFGTSGRYASSLVELASTVGRSVEFEVGASSGPSGRGDPGASSLFQRVLMLLKCPFAIERQTPIWWRWSTAATLGLVTLTASCLTLRGLAGWSTSTASPSVESSRSFRIPQLLITQREHDDQPFDLRFRLPDRFTLAFELMAEPADLPDLQVLGHRLGPASDPGPAREVYRLWHRVLIRRGDGPESVEVDGRKVAPGPGPVKPATWLTIRPSPGKTVRVRDLELDW